MTQLFEDLKQNSSSRIVQDEAGKRLKNITDEVEKMKREMEDKQRQIQGNPPTPPSRAAALPDVDADAVNAGKFRVPRIRGQDPPAHQA